MIIRINIYDETGATQEKRNYIEIKMKEGKEKSLRNDICSHLPKQKNIIHIRYILKLITERENFGRHLLNI